VARQSQRPVNRQCYARSDIKASARRRRRPSPVLAARTFARAFILNRNLICISKHVHARRYDG